VLAALDLFRGPHHQSNVPDQDDFEARINRLLQTGQQAAIDFVFSQLTVGITSCQIAKTRPDRGLDDHRALRQAQMALSTAERFMWRCRLNHSEFDQMTALAERLRLELNALTDRKL
jgi:hypothetical protein